MTFALHSRFNTQDVGSISVTSEETSLFGFPFVVDVELEGSFFPAVSGTIINTYLSSAIGELEAALNAAGTAGYTGSYDHSTNRFRLRSSEPVTYGFNQSAQRVFGFASASYGPATSLFSDISPWYIFQTEQDDCSKFFQEYEIMQPNQERISDNGRSYSVGRRSAAKYASFSVINEPLAKVFKHNAAPQTPWTLEHFFEHTRTTNEFIIFNQTGSTVIFDSRLGVYRNTGRGSVFDPQELFPDWHVYWNHRFDLQRILGKK